jgi:hypothetical protein
MRRKVWSFGIGRRSVAGMLVFMSAVLSPLSCPFRRRADLELEVVALRHQLNALRRQRPGRSRLYSGDRLLSGEACYGGAVTRGASTAMPPAPSAARRTHRAAQARAITIDLVSGAAFITGFAISDFPVTTSTLYQYR